ncbi:MAG: alanine racemase, partial [Bacteroidales bacterium]|nr:alanine racemase [Bacteroidales bacterium]
MSIAQNIQNIKATLPDNVRLCAVSKYHPIEALKEAYDAGQRIFGESREQELCQKYEALPKDIEWHFIGHLQTNKVKYIAPFVSLIQSVDSERLLDEINKQAIKNNRTIDVLLQIHVAQEDTKTGFDPF